ncbi:methyl-accepting chemotaxis protein [Vibrio sp. V09_P4A23P171]|uniref:methyl-accepting chemotaxis protein n=1 Tax=Vibrio sp. V09_P4A23P171 TaxID=1938664 RepID=UPI000B8E74D4|nr:methyl-accepting chemotaxis protein [Vibrio sp. V09_P4A23P171]OXX39536.1 methyl-accepting chemotaxis protein [Vibrio sp. V09_P4A23P171]
MQWIKDLSITQKMISLITLMLCLIVGVASFSALKMNRIALEIEEIADESIPLIRLSSDITIKQLESSIVLEKAFRLAKIPVEGNSQALKDLTQKTENIAKVLESELTQAKQILSDAKKHRQAKGVDQESQNRYQTFEALERSYHQYEVALFQLLKRLNSNEPVEQLAPQVLVLEKMQEAFNTEIEHFLRDLEQKTATSILITEDEEHRALQGTITLAVVSIILGLVMGTLLSRQIVRSVLKVRNIAAKMANGHFDQHIVPESKDEIGQLTQSMNTMADSLSKTVGEVIQRANSIAGLVTELNVLAENNRKAMLVQQESTQQVAAAMEQMASTITEVASNAEGAAESTTRADNSVKAACETTDVTQKISHQLVINAANSQKMILELQDSTHKIQNFVSVVDSISEQTNLLALNAAIEAARAGEQGRGFAVVADEVRALASRSQEATHEISSLIQVLVNKAQIAAKSIEDNDQQISESSTLVDSAKAQLYSIAGALDELMQSNLQVASASEQQAVSAEEVSQNLLGIRDSGDKVLVSTEETANASNDLSQQANDLKALMSQFSVRKLA